MKTVPLAQVFWLYGVRAPSTIPYSMNTCVYLDSSVYLHMCCLELPVIVKSVLNIISFNNCILYAECAASFLFHPMY